MLLLLICNSLSLEVFTQEEDEDSDTNMTFSEEEKDNDNDKLNEFPITLINKEKEPACQASDVCVINED